MAGLSACLLLGVVGCQQSTSTSDSPTSSAAEVPKVAAVAVRLEPWPKTVRVQGSLLGDENSVIGSKLAGIVEHVKVDLGSVVHKGDPLVILDQRELKLRVSQAEAQLNQACAAIGLDPANSELELNRENSPPVMLEKATLAEAEASFARAETLRPKQAIAESEYDRLQALVKTAQARYRSALNNVGEQIALIGVRRVDLAVAEQMLTDSSVVAPFHGIVAQRHVSPGEYVQSGQALVDLVRTDRLRFTAGVPERYAREIAVGQPVSLKLPGLDEPLETKISRASPSLTLASRSLWIEADVQNPELKFQAGLFAEAEIVIDPTAESITVPAAAVAEFAGLQKVWVVHASQAKEQAVRIGRREADRLEIIDGLAAGDIVIQSYSEGRSGEIATVLKSAEPAHHAAVERPAEALVD